MVTWFTIEINLGHNSINNMNDSSDSSSDILSQVLVCHLSIFHMNIQSIVPKMKLIKAEADTYDILFTESWLKLWKAKAAKVPFLNGTDKVEMN